MNFKLLLHSDYINLISDEEVKNDGAEEVQRSPSPPPYSPISQQECMPFILVRNVDI